MVNWGRKAKSNTKYVKFTGKAVYVKAYVPDEYNGKETWKCGLTVSKDTWNAVRESGSQMKKRLAEGIPNIDENTPYVVFNRDVVKEFRDGKTYYSPPFIYGKDGEKKVWYVDEEGNDKRWFKEDDKQPERRGEAFLIGNGSDIEVTVSIYPAGSYGHGTRLESIRVIDLIEYEPEDKKSDTQSKALDKKDTKDKGARLDDDIPFDEKSTQPNDEVGDIGW